MPRVIYNQTNFTAGEISPRVLGRVDIDRYSNAVELCENALPLIHGGVTNRYGSLFVARAKNALLKARLIPFVFSTTQAYVLEFGVGYLRFYTNNAQVLNGGFPYEIATTYTEDQLFGVDYVQAKDTMFAFHQDAAIYRIRRFADDSWDAGAAPFSVLPFDEIGDQFAVSLTLSAATVGSGRTVTASGATFLASDVGRSITYQGGTLFVTAYTDSTHVTGDISTPFPSTAVPVSAWSLTGSPQSTVTPSVKDPVGASITLTGGINTWRTSDVGKFVSINGGTVEITGYTSALAVTGVIQQVLTGTTAAPPDSWTLKGAVWSTALGYPRCGTFYQQRLCVAGSRSFPDRLWGSATGLYLDFTIGTNDDDAFAFDLTSDQSNPAVHLVSGSDLLPMTYGGEFSVRGGIEKAITPTNIQVDPETTYGISSVKPFRAGKELVYVDNFGTQVLAMKYFAADDAYDSSDLTALAEHITGPGLQDMSYARKRDPIIFGVRTDGVIAACTFSREQSVVAWSRWTRDAVYESVATIPTSTGSQTWVLVRMTVGGNTVRYIERFDSNTLMDSAITGISGPGANVWSGLGHLEGRTVACIADGADMGDFVVVGGSITLPRNAFTVSIGIPFTSTVKLLTPELQTGEGSSQGQAMSTSEISVKVLNTQSLIINDVVVPFRELGPVLLDQPPPTFTGIKKIPNLAWANGASDITITNTRPLRFHVLSVIRTLTVNS